MFRTYLGIDPQTGKAKHTSRRGFTTEKQAQLEMKRIKFSASKDQTTKTKKGTRIISIDNTAMNYFKR